MPRACSTCTVILRMGASYNKEISTLPYRPMVDDGDCGRCRSQSDFSEAKSLVSNNGSCDNITMHCECGNKNVRYVRQQLARFPPVAHLHLGYYYLWLTLDPCCLVDKVVSDIFSMSNYCFVRYDCLCASPSALWPHSRQTPSPPVLSAADLVRKKPTIAWSYFHFAPAKWLGLVAALTFTFAIQ